MTEDEKKPKDKSQQYLANQRTFLAWIRTCIVLIGLGFLISKFNIFLREFSPVAGETVTEASVFDTASSYLGIGIIAFSIGILVYAMKNYFVGFNEIESGAYKPNNSIVFFSAIGVIIFSAAIIAYLLISSA